MPPRKRLGPGQKSIQRGSTFKTQKPRKRRTERRPDPLDVEAILRDNPKARPGKAAPGSAGWTQRVFALYGRTCRACPGRRPKRAVQAHHAVPQRTIEAREGRNSPLMFDARNGVPLCFDCHMAHENASRRVRRDCLDPGNIQWAVDNGFDWYLDDRRVYP